MTENMFIIQEPGQSISFDGGLFDGDPEFLAEIVNLFLATYPDLLSEIDRAVLRHDAEALRRAAHTMKGAVANFGARQIVEQAKAIETIGQSGELEPAESAVRSLHALMEHFVPELQAAVEKTGEKQVST